MQSDAIEHNAMQGKGGGGKLVDTDIRATEAMQSVRGNLKQAAYETHPETPVSLISIPKEALNACEMARR